MEKLLESRTLPSPTPPPEWKEVRKRSKEERKSLPKETEGMETKLFKYLYGRDLVEFPFYEMTLNVNRLFPAIKELKTP